MIRRLVALLLLLTPACAGMLAGKDSMAPHLAPRACATDQDCSKARNEVCRAANGSGAPGSGGAMSSKDGICVIPAPSVPTSEIYLEVRPLSEAVPPTQFGPVDLANGQNQQLVLPAPGQVSGTVVLHSNRAPVVQAKLHFQFAPLIPDRPLSFDATSGGDQGDQPGAFSLLLPQGNFRLTVVPPISTTLDPLTDQPLVPPPEHPFTGAVSLSTLAAVPQAIEVSGPNELVNFAGTAQVARGGSPVPVPAGVDVWAVDADSIPASATGAQALQGTLLAQPVTTDQSGSFSLWLPRLPDGQSAYHVRLQLGPSSNGAQFPSFVDPTVYTVDGTSKPQAAARAPIEIDRRVDVSGQVLAASPDGVPIGVADAQVTFHTDDETSPFSYSTTVLTDATGAYQAKLFPGAYLPLAVLPPSEPTYHHVPWGLCPPVSRSDFVVQAGESATQDFECDYPRDLAVDLAGESLSGGAPVPFVAVEAVRRADDQVDQDLHLRAVSDETGVFSLYVPAGEYTLILTPPSNAKLPVTTESVGALSPPLDPTDPNEQPPRLMIELDQPFDLFGQLFSANASHPLAASIEAYVVNADKTSQLVGQGASSSDGSYSLIVPATGP